MVRDGGDPNLETVSAVGARCGVRYYRSSFGAPDPVALSRDRLQSPPAGFSNAPQKL
jgi:hypothetical protein